MQITSLCMNALLQHGSLLGEAAVYATNIGRGGMKLADHLHTLKCRT